MQWREYGGIHGVRDHWASILWVGVSGFGNEVEPSMVRYGTSTSIWSNLSNKNHTRWMANQTRPVNPLQWEGFNFEIFLILLCNPQFFIIRQRERMQRARTLGRRIFCNRFIPQSLRWPVLRDIDGRAMSDLEQMRDSHRWILRGNEERSEAGAHYAGRCRPVRENV